MKIAIPVPSPVPFSPGGIEKLAAGMAEALEESGHQVEVIKIPAPESTLCQIVRSYLRFWSIDLRHFDLVVSLKYPGWMCRSNKHIVYMCHRLRGLYDTYPLPHGLKTWLSGSLLRFPGPLIRSIVHWLDRIALKSSKVSHFFCLSNTVKNRTEYFPKDCYEPRVLFPPTSLKGLKTGEFDYFFTVSRLDAPKRIDLLISAMRNVRADSKFLIAGDGPQRPYLESLAASDPRIEFLGPVTDERLAELYSNALAVLFAPVQEDFGLVTVEAMKCGKPVISCIDSGGPTELIVDGENGFICEPRAEVIADRMTRLAENPDLAGDLGKKGLESVSEITWEKLVEGLLRPYNYLQLTFGNARLNKKNICVLSPYGISPPVGGGKARIFQLYRHLARYYNVVVISVGNYDEQYQLNELADGLFEVRVPMTPVHSRMQWELEKAAGLPISDVAMPRLMKETPMLKEVIDYFSAKSEVLVASHPYLFDAIHRHERTRLVVYEAHNVETRLKSESLKGTSVGRKLLSETRRIEGAACAKSDVIWATSDEEVADLTKMFGIDSGKAWIVPNAVDTTSITMTSSEVRKQAKGRLGYGDRPVALFIASWHPPNLDGLLFLKDNLSPALGNWDIVVVGSVKDQYLSVFNNLIFPSNLKVLGVVPEDVKNLWLSAADVALNPVTSGAGTSLKMFDYMAAGVPIITTRIGARGTGLIDGEHAFICELSRFQERICQLLGDASLSSRLTASARDLAVERFDWSKIADKVHVLLEERMPSSLPREFDAGQSRHFSAGWYSAESWEGKFAFRWSNGDGFLVAHNPKRDSRLKIELLKGASSRLEILANGDLIGELVLKDGWQKVEIDLPRIIDGDAIEVALRCEPWRPADIDGGSDFRNLGVALRSCEVA
ncbi:MAG: glycosyltransferase family 4 protein [Candidatus Coatesbacteria bacterium]|nr:glycosyltransferase family 4 protein [Candidatus Coatesbacteria bacterium]